MLIRNLHGFIKIKVTSKKVISPVFESNLTKYFFDLFQKLTIYQTIKIFTLYPTFAQQFSRNKFKIPQN